MPKAGAWPTRLINDDLTTEESEVVPLLVIDGEQGFVHEQLKAMTLLWRQRRYVFAN
jgi:hypothetical protein